MKLESTDQPKFSEFMAALVYFVEKYGGDVVMGELVRQMTAQQPQAWADLDDEQKALMYSEGVKTMTSATAEAARVFHDELFPFGHPNQPLTIGDSHA